MRRLDEIRNHKNIISTEIMAKKTKKIILIVEGDHDEIKFNLIKNSKELKEKNIEVISIGYLPIFEKKQDENDFNMALEQGDEKLLTKFYKNEGAIPVINFIEKIELDVGIDKAKGYVLGIVDRDSICYKRKETKENELLYVLDYYSIESFYVNKEVIDKTLNKLIIEPDLIDSSIVNNIYQETINKTINKLYYISLEALRKSCQSDYLAITGYKPDNVDNFINEQKDKLLSKVDELNEFANQKGIKKENMEVILKIVKGKWLISTFCSVFLDNIRKLKEMCKNNEIRKCNRCNIPISKKFPCLYGFRNKKMNENTLKEEMIFTLVDLKSLTPIKERIKQLK